MTPYEIPLTATPQQFQIQLTGITYTMLVLWSKPAACWLLSILDSESVPILNSLPLQPGVDILAQHGYLGIPGQLWVQSDGDLNKVPGFYELGVGGHLYYLAP